MSPKVSNPSSAPVSKEHTLFLEKVLSVAEAIPTSPITPPGTDQPSLITPRAATLPSPPRRKRSLIPVSSLLNHDTQPAQETYVGPKPPAPAPAFGFLVSVASAAADELKTTEVIVDNPPRLPAFSELPFDGHHVAPSRLSPPPLPRLTIPAPSTSVPANPVLAVPRRASYDCTSPAVGNVHRRQEGTDGVSTFATHCEGTPVSRKRAVPDGIGVGADVPYAGQGGGSNDTAVPTPKRRRRREVKSLPCLEPGCQVRFSQPSALRSHVRTVHHGERRFSCPHEGCNARFGASGDVTRHVNSVHERKRNSVCDICGLRMSRNTVLYRHMRNVHGKEPDISAIRKAARSKRDNQSAAR